MAHLSAVDPELAEGLAAMPTLANLSHDSLPAIRSAIEALAQEQFRNVPRDDVCFFEREIEGQQGSPAIRILVYRPANARKPLPVLLRIHGGGFVMGAPELHHASSIEIARTLLCCVVSVQYRLAPEVPYPGALEDCYAVVKWLGEFGDTIGADCRPVCVMGESAGGGISASLALCVRDRKACRIASQLLIYPMLDDRSCVADENAHANFLVWTADNSKFGWEAYLGCKPGSPGVDVRAVPARCNDLVGLPPTFIACGALDLFLDESLEYGRRLIRAGVQTELHVYPGAFHGFDVIAGAQVSKKYKRDLYDGLARMLGR